MDEEGRERGAGETQMKKGGEERKKGEGTQM